MSVCESVPYVLFLWSFPHLSHFHIFSHLHIFTSSHPHIFKCLHLYLFTSHIFTSSKLYVLINICLFISISLFAPCTYTSFFLRYLHILRHLHIFLSQLHISLYFSWCSGHPSSSNTMVIAVIANETLWSSHWIGLTWETWDGQQKGTSHFVEGLSLHWFFCKKRTLRNNKKWLINPCWVVIELLIQQWKSWAKILQ